LLLCTILYVLCACVALRRYLIFSNDTTIELRVH
jgi:hypothetical protein